MADGAHCSADIQRIGIEQGWHCAGCNADIRGCHQVDHVIALSKGGSNGPNNLQLLCRPCNTRKGTKSLLVFMAEMRPLVFNENNNYGAAYFAMAGESAAQERI
jgi:5-methylcytosine-specific restriction endonuclease McrA